MAAGLFPGTRLEVPVVAGIWVLPCLAMLPDTAGAAHKVKGSDGNHWGVPDIPAPHR